MKLTGMDIIAAINDPKLLGASFRKRLFKGDSWRNWKCFLKVLFALALDTDELAFYRKATGRMSPPSEPFRECFVCSGRRSGKTFIISLLVVFCACFVDYSRFLSVGEVPFIAIFAASRDQANVLMRYIRAHFAASTVLKAMVATDGRDFIELKSGLRIEILTSDPKTLRGRTIVLGCIDEQAFLDPSVDAEILGAIRPSQVTIANSLLVGISTPWRRAGSLYKEVSQHHGDDKSATLIWRASSREMNPTISATSVALAFARDAVSARTEFDAEFRSDLESYLSRESVEAVVVNGRLELPPRKGIEYTAFCDLSGGRVDSATLAIAHVENDAAILDCIREVCAPFSPQAACQEFAATLKAYNTFTVTGDKYAGNFPSTEFALAGIQYSDSERDRSQIYVEFLPLVTSQRTLLLDNKKLISQLCALERRTGAGRDRIDHPPSGFDDICNSAAGSLVLCLEGAGVFGLLDFLKSDRAQELARMTEAGITTELTSTKPSPTPMSEAKKKWWDAEQRRLGEQ